MNNESKYSITQFLRLVGTIALVLSGVIFLYQGINHGDGVERFLGFGAFLIGLAGAGVFCVKKLKEPKGARAFMAIAVGGIGALFAQTGGMIFDVLFPNANIQLPQAFLTPIQGTAGTLICTALLGVIGIPLAKMGFRVLSREYHKPLWLAYIASCSLLLVPIRGTVAPFIYLAIMMGVSAKLLKDSDYFKNVRHTFETKIATSLLLLPLLIVAVRSFFYLSGPLLTMLVAALGASFAFFGVYLEKAKGALITNENSLVPQKKSATKLKVLADLGGVFGAIAWLSFCVEIDHVIRPFPNLVEGVIYLLPAYLWVRLGYEVTERKTGMLKDLVVWLFTLMFCFQFVGVNLIESHVFIILGLLGIVDGYAHKLKHEFYAGVVLFIAGFLSILSLVIEHINFLQWLPLAILGTLVILAASQIESQSDKIKSRWTGLKGHFE